MQKNIFAFYAVLTASRLLACGLLNSVKNWKLSFSHSNQSKSFTKYSFTDMHLFDILRSQKWNYLEKYSKTKNNGIYLLLSRGASIFLCIIGKKTHLQYSFQNPSLSSDLWDSETDQFSCDYFQPYPDFKNFLSSNLLEIRN